MSMISDQINKLREAVKSYRPYVPYYVIGLLHNAADTIESLSAKLQAKEYCDGCPGADIKEIPCTEECKRRHFKAENMQRSAEDCGGGWIPCSVDHMPHRGSAVLIRLRSVYDGITGDDDYTYDISYFRSDKNEWISSCGTYPFEDVKAWRPIEPYHES